MKGSELQAHGGKIGEVSTISWVYLLRGKSGLYLPLLLIKLYLRQ